MYPSLSAERALALETLLVKIKKTSAKMATSDGVRGEKRTRKNAREKISFALLFGLEELQEQGRSLEVEGKPFDLATAPEDDRVDLCNRIAVRIETGLFVSADERVDKNYAEKFRRLATNLQHPENTDLRTAVLCQDVDARSMANMSAEELAPKVL